MNYWAWGGKYIGHRSGDYLYYSNGSPLGYFDGNEVYDFNSRYLCEVKKQ